MTFNFLRIPIRWKIVLIMLGVTAIGLILVGAGMLAHTRLTFEQQTKQKLTLLADVIGLNSTAALAFNDPAAAMETLAALRGDEHVLAGGLYDTNGRLFARYQRENDYVAVPESVPPVNVWTFGDGRAAMARSVLLKGRSQGTVYLVADTSEWRNTLWGFLGIIGMLFLGVLVVGFFISIWLQRLVTYPIVELAQTMRRVGQERDYSLRAVKRGEDELGTLVEGFNAMLDEIGKGRTAIERARDELHQLNEELEQRVLDRTAQLEIANKELEAFSYSVSHDRRAPLRALDGFSRILLADYGTKLDDAGRDSLDRVRRAAQHMAMLIDDLLKLARVTRTEPNREPVNLSALAREVFETLRAQDPARQVAFVVAPMAETRGDSRLLRIALENLLGNAWKFTGGRADPRIELGTKNESDGLVYFVRDNGAGFDMAYAGKLFAPFQRLHTLEEFPGTGIGLATVQRIVHKHGGRIWAESAIGEGAAFYFTLTKSDTDTGAAP
jgi:signal transduction histidine kinase